VLFVGFQRKDEAMNTSAKTAFIAIPLVLMWGTAMAQIRDPNIPAGTAGSILSGTPSGTSAGSMAPRTVPPVGYEQPSATGRSSGCTVGCAPMIAPKSHR
jgi:hypothetical protein